MTWQSFNSPEHKVKRFFKKRNEQLEENLSNNNELDGSDD